MIAPALYLLIWLLILGSAVVYADDFIKVIVCSRGEKHPLDGTPVYIRKAHIIGFADDFGAVADNVCTKITLATGAKMFIDGSTAQLREKLENEMRDQ